MPLRAKITIKACLGRNGFYTKAFFMLLIYGRRVNVVILQMNGFINAIFLLCVIYYFNYREHSAINRKAQFIK